jgi:hypothetical protein
MTAEPTRRKRLLLTATVSLLSTAKANGTRAASQQNRRRLHKERTLTAWRSLESASVRPLDLKLDESDPLKVYQVGIGGFLEPYDFTNYQVDFATTHLDSSSNEGPALSSSKTSLGEGGGNAEGIVHVQSDRIAATNFDLNRWMKLKGYQDVERALMSEHDDENANGARVVSASIFKYTEDNDPYNLHDDDNEASSSRKLKGAADEFADNEAPVVRSTFPPNQTKIGPNQSFGALVSDNGTGVKSVCLQLRDHVNSLSDCFELVNVGYDVYELTFDGFDAYEGMTWSYRIRSKDGAKNRANTPWADFIINISGKGESETDNGGGSGGQDENGDTTDTNNGVLTQEVRDESWPYGGVVQKSTGRILFFFDGNAYVCTGTVLDDEIQDRTVIVSLLSVVMS